MAEDEESLLGRYWLSWKENNFQECKIIIDKVIQIDSEKSFYHHLRGNCLTQLKQYEEAIEAQKKAIVMEKKLSTSIHYRSL